MPPPPPPPPPPPIFNPHILEANGTHQGKSETPSFLVFMNAVNIFTHFLLGAVAFSAISFASSARGSVTIGIWIIGFPASLSQHIYLCVIGYVVLMSQALLVFNPYVGWATYLKKSEKRIIHIIMQVGGSALAIAGSIIKMADAATSWNSPHAWLGFVAMILTVFSLFGGIMNFICSRNGEKNIATQLVHTCLGAITLIVAFMALIVAFNEYYREAVDNSTANLSISFTVLALVSILTLVFVKLFRRN